MVTTAASIPAPIIEPVLLSGTNLTLRVTRVPGSVTVGGYRIYRASTADAWAKVEGTDYVACSPTLAQPATSVPLTTVTLTSQPSTGTAYYRARAEDVLGSATQYSPWSNVVTVYERSGARVAVPAWPTDVRPNVGALAGVVRQFEDYDQDAGLTWHDARTVMARVAEQLTDELSQSMSDGAVYAIFENPPPALRQWFEYAVATELVHRSSLPTEVLDEVAGRLERRMHDWWDELIDDSGTFLLPGAGTGTTGGTRLIR